MKLVDCLVLRSGVRWFNFHSVTGESMSAD